MGTRPVNRYWQGQESGSSVLSFDAEGEITMQAELFPKEIWHKIMNNGGRLPVLKITLENVFLTNGIEMHSSLDEGFTAKLAFEVVGIEIEETK